MAGGETVPFHVMPTFSLEYLKFTYLWSSLIFKYTYVDVLQQYCMPVLAGLKFLADSLPYMSGLHEAYLWPSKNTDLGMDDGVEQLSDL